MEKQLTPLEAFNDFLEWVKYSGTWSQLTPSQKNRIITARRDRDEKRGEAMALGNLRIKRLLTEYAPGRYEFRESVILHEK